MMRVEYGGRRDGAARQKRRDDKRGQENNNKETRREDNVRRRAGVHSCFLLVRRLNLADQPASLVSHLASPACCLPFFVFFPLPFPRLFTAGPHLI